MSNIYLYIHEKYITNQDYYYQLEWIIGASSLASRSINLDIYLNLCIKYSWWGETYYNFIEKTYIEEEEENDNNNRRKKRI